MVKERSEDQSEDFRIKQTALLASPVFIGQAQGEGKHIKRRAKELSLSLLRTGILVYSLGCPHA